MRAQSADAAAAETVWKKRQHSAYRDAATMCPTPSCLSPLLDVSICAGGGRPEDRWERSAGKTSTEKSQRAVASESGQAEGRKNRTL